MGQPCKGTSLPRKPLTVLYCVACLVIYGVYEAVAERHFASILTVAAMVQLLAFALLGLQVLSRRTTDGVSRRMLMLYAVGLCFKLSSTMFFNGYLPADPTGDFIFQAVDVGSLAIVVWLLCSSFSEPASETSQMDDLPIVPVLAGCLVLAMLMHGNMNSRPLFDTFWLMGLLVDQLAVVPQIWLITRCGGRVEGMTSHHMAAMVVSRACSFLFFWEAWDDITSDPYRHFEGVSQCIWAIAFAHLVHLIVVADFAYFYVRNLLQNGVSKIEYLRVCYSV